MPGFAAPLAMCVPRCRVTLDPEVKEALGNVVFVRVTKDKDAESFESRFANAEAPSFVVLGADGETKGFVKVTADRKGRILGATILGHGAGELLMPLVLAKQNGIPLSKISGTVFPYPTRVEGVKRAADAYQRGRLEGTGGRILRKVVSWLT